MEKAQQELERRKQQFEEFKQQKYILPQITFDQRCTIYLGNDEIQLLYFGAGHTNGDVIVHFPAERVIHVGDLFFLNNWVPRLDADTDASIDNWLKIYERILELDFEKVIPGHGNITDKEGFIKRASLSMSYLKDLKSEVQKFVSQGVALEQIKAKLKLPKYQAMELHELLLPYNIDGAYQEIMANNRPK